MRRWFLSYHSPDLALAERLVAAIETHDRAAQIFLAAKDLRVGGYWQEALAREIAEAEIFVLLIGQGGIGPWQVTEYSEALDRSVKDRAFPIVLVLIEGQTAPGLPFLRQFNWIVTPDPASEKDFRRLMDAATGASRKPEDLWRHTSPYRGLAAMTEADSDFFFGRERQTVEALEALAASPDRLPVLVGNSGVGKSSIAQAGIIACLKRQAWPERLQGPAPWPQPFRESRRWCFLKIRPGTEPLRSLVEAFIDTWRFNATEPERVGEQNGWVELLRDGKATLRDLLDATERRYVELAQPQTVAFFLYVDQGEELYVRSEERQRRRFSEILAQGLGDPRLYVLMSLRADFSGALQNDEPLFAVHRRIEVPPLREAQLNEVVSRPAVLLGARFEREGLAADIARRTAEESVKDAGALPLLSYLLDDMWTKMVARGDGELRLPAAAIDLGGVLAERADNFIASRPGTEEALRHLLTLKLATIREDGEPTRRRASRSEFTDTEWRLVSELADHPNRLLVTATPENGEAYAEVAHEAIFWRWEKLRHWIVAERAFLAWRTGLEAARRSWEAASEGARGEALLMGYALAQARDWLRRREGDLPASDREFIVASLERRRRERTRGRRVQGLIYVLLVSIILGLVGWMNQAYIHQSWRWFTAIRPYMAANIHPFVLTAEAERALQPLARFKECAKDCPEMVAIPAGAYRMGSPGDEYGRYDNEGPQHEVVLAKPFAVSSFDVTFDDWSVCAAYGDCDPGISDSGFGRGRQPVINVTFEDARRYASWLSRITGKPYRLLTEAEWEYAARAGTRTAFSFGDDDAMLGRYAWYGKNSGRQAHPVGEKEPNAFGLYDMHGNVFQWVEDCVHGNYDGAPGDGSAWIGGGDCSGRIVRGGSWNLIPHNLRSAYRSWYAADLRLSRLGFRVGRALGP